MSIQNYRSNEDAAVVLVHGLGLNQIFWWVVQSEIKVRLIQRQQVILNLFDLFVIEAGVHVNLNRFLAHLHEAKINQTRERINQEVSGASVHRYSEEIAVGEFNDNCGFFKLLTGLLGVCRVEVGAVGLKVDVAECSV